MKFLFVLAQLGASSCMWISVKKNALCELCGTCYCFVHYFLLKIWDFVLLLRLGLFVNF